MKTKVCFFSPASYPFFIKESKINHGGAELQMFLLAEYISKQKKHKTCFFIGNYGKKPKHKDINLISTIKNIQKENFFSKIFNGLRYLLQLIKEKPDIIFCTNANAFVGINSFYAKIFKKKSIFRTSHQIDVDKTYIKQNGLSGKIYKYGLKNAHIVVTQNESHKKLLKKNHNIDAKVLKNAFIIKKITKKNSNYVFWVGRFEKWKQPELFLKIAKHFPNNKFVMVCPYTKSRKKEWEVLKQKVSVISNLQLIEKIAFNKIQTFFNNASLFINTSEYEGFPNTFLQAAQGKTPIISLNVNPDDFITKYNCGIFANGNFNNLLKSTEVLIKNKTQQAKMGENLYAYLKSNHDINVIGKQFNKIIENII